MEQGSVFTSRATLPSRRWVIVLGVLVPSAVLSTPAAATHGIPHVATDPENIDEAARILEALGPYNVANTPAAPGDLGPGADTSPETLQKLFDLPAADNEEPGSRIQRA